MGENQSKGQQGGSGGNSQGRGGRGGRGNSVSGGSVPEDRMNSHIKKMDQEMRRKLGKGASYNMKVVIKGDRNTGKTCLLQRLQGLPFKEEYTPSHSIGTANIHWNYRATDDVVKVEVWDVVDKGKPTRGKSISGADVVPASAGGVAYPVADPTAPPSPSPGEAPSVLDASLIDVYKGAHAAIFIFDITKKWTWDYVKSEISRINNNDLPTLIIANFRDHEDRRVVSMEEVIDFVYSQEDNVRAIECSVQNCFGFKALYSFLNIPFLHLQKQELQLQLERNQTEYDQAVSEFDIITDELDYQYYLKWVEQNKAAQEAKKRKLFGGKTNSPAPSNPIPTPSPRGTPQQQAAYSPASEASPVSQTAAQIQADVAAAVAAKKKDREELERALPPRTGSAPRQQPASGGAPTQPATGGTADLASFQADDSDDDWLADESDVEIAAPIEEPSDQSDDSESDDDSDDSESSDGPRDAPVAAAPPPVVAAPAPVIAGEDEGASSSDDDDLEGGGLYIEADEDPEEYGEAYVPAVRAPEPEPAPVAAAKPEPTLSPEQLAALEAAFALPEDPPAAPAADPTPDGDGGVEKSSSRRHKHRSSRSHRDSEGGGKERSSRRKHRRHKGDD